MQFTKEWISPAKIAEFVILEPVLIFVLAALLCWLSYKIILRDLSIDRHRTIRAQFKNLAGHIIFLLGLFIAYTTLNRLFGDDPTIRKALAYEGVITICWGAIVFVKIARMGLLLYLFGSHMKEAVPILVVNLFSLLILILISSWIATNVFGVELASVLTTSAVLSIVIGLAMQDTLGNLFAGIALQFDKPYEIGDWIEVHTGPQKWVGQVQEITWRATTMLGFLDETITVSNRVMAQAQISNYSVSRKPFCRSVIFKVPYGTDVARVRTLLVESIDPIPEVRRVPEPFAIISEATESWIAVKLVYFIADYGRQYLIADEVISRALQALESEGVSIAQNRLLVIKEAEAT